MHRIGTITAAQPGWLSDVLALTKVRLTLLVVFSAVIGYLVAAAGHASWLPVLLLSIAGFCVAGAANALNQILEKDYDAMMERTAGRPVASGRMSPSEALVIAGIMLFTGIVILALFNPLAAFLGMLSFILYAFFYTPMKRYGTLSVAIGAIPGALPVVIGIVAYQGSITWLAVVLFAIQFIWQFPHFWSIGWLSYDQYRRAGFKLMPASATGEVNRNLGMHTVMYALLLIPVCAFSYAYGVTTLVPTAAIASVSLWYAWRAWLFHRHFDARSARQLMFASFAYLPVVLLILLIGSMA